MLHCHRRCSNFFVGEIIDITLPTASGTGTIQYTLTRPNGASFETAFPEITLNADTNTLSGRVTGSAFTARTFTYTATNAQGTDTLTFTIAVAANNIPTFADGASIPDQIFTVNQPVNLTLPGVVPGTGDVSITYTVTPALPANLVFDPTPRPAPSPAHLRPPLWRPRPSPTLPQTGMKMCWATPTR